MRNQMREMITLFNTFSNYYNGFVDEIEENIDFVKRFCNIQELKVKVNDGEYIYMCDAYEIMQRKREWNLEQHAVWYAWNCALFTSDGSSAFEAVGMYEYAIRSLLALSSPREEEEDHIASAV